QEDILYVMIEEKENRVLAESAKGTYPEILKESKEQVGIQTTEGQPVRLLLPRHKIELYEFSAPVVTTEEERSREEIGLAPMSAHPEAHKKVIGRVRLGI